MLCRSGATEEPGTQGPADRRGAVQRLERRRFNRRQLRGSRVWCEEVSAVSRLSIDRLVSLEFGNLLRPSHPDSWWLFRSMRGDEAKRVCPGINLVQVPVARGKADLNLYRSAGSEVCSPV